MQSLPRGFVEKLDEPYYIMHFHGFRDFCFRSAAGRHYLGL